MNRSLIKPIKSQISKKKKKGFTLVELIIVIAVIAILAAIAIPKMGTVRENANIKADVANAKNIHTATASALIDGKIKNGGTYDLSKTTGADSGKEIKDRLDAYSKSKVYSDKDFKAVVSNDGNITIQVDDKDVYPELDKNYGKTEEKPKKDS